MLNTQHLRSTPLIQSQTCQTWPVLGICGFHVCEFTYSLKLIHSPAIQPLRASEGMCAAKTNLSPLTCALTAEGDPESVVLHPCAPSVIYLVPSSSHFCAFCW